MSREGWLARLTIMLEVLPGKDVISVLHYTKTHFQRGRLIKAGAKRDGVF